jgi:hypothetical protein
MKVKKLNKRCFSSASQENAPIFSLSYQPQFFPPSISTDTPGAPVIGETSVIDASQKAY